MVGGGFFRHYWIEIVINDGDSVETEKVSEVGTPSNQEAVHNGRGRGIRFGTVKEGDQAR